MPAHEPEPVEPMGEVPAFLRGTTPGRGAGRPSPRRSAQPASGQERPPVPPIDPAALPMPLSRRRLAVIAAGLVLTLIAVGFGREVSDAAAASDRATQLRATNATLSTDLANVQRDLARVGQETYLDVAARAYGMGAKHEIPFALDPTAPSLPPDAPGSAANRVGADAAPGPPLDAWLDLLFGSGR